jgi:hypothetical protein
MSIQLTDITQDQYDAAEAVLIDLVRAAYPSFDLRRGTVLRDLLLRTSAQIVARDEALMEELRQKQSLIALAENAGTVDADDADAVNAILSNFNMTRDTGANASGQVLVRVSGDRLYTVAEGFIFTSLAGNTYDVVDSVVARTTPDELANEQQLYLSDDGSYYYFFVTVQSTAPGADYTLQAGDALNAGSSLYGFIAAEAYAEFSQGLDDETIAEAITRIPAAISYRALESRISIEAKLRDEFNSAAFRIQDVAVQGYGDAAQLRDKHNPMGFAVGSRVDVYAKTFTTPHKVTIQKTGTRVAPNTYQIALSATDAPGYYAIRAISEVEATTAPAVGFGALPTFGSYAFDEVRQPSGVADTFHDIDSASVPEIAFSVWQQGSVVITGVPHSEAEREFKVELYTAPGLAAMQSFVDSELVRNLEADYIVRCPLICMVELHAYVYYSAAYPVDVPTMQHNLANLINTRPFGYTLTRSELVQQLLSDGATRVDLGEVHGMQLKGNVIDGSGVRHTLERDALDIQLIEDASTLLVPATVVFGAEDLNLVIETISDA